MGFSCSSHLNKFKTTGCKWLPLFAVMSCEQFYLLIHVPCALLLIGPCGRGLNICWILCAFFTLWKLYKEEPSFLTSLNSIKSPKLPIITIFLGIAMSSRFTEYFDIQQSSCNSLADFKYDSENCSNQTLYQVDSNQHSYYCKDFYRRQSLANTIDSMTSNYSINEQCSLRRKSRVTTRRHSENSFVSSLALSSISKSSLLGWCRRQKMKIFMK